MGTADREAHEIHGKVVYFGPTGAGKSANLQFIQRKLKREHRGELKRQTARDGTSTYDVLPVSLGAVRGYKTSIQITTVPGATSAAAIRRELLKDVDGIVFVADLRPERHDATLASAAELRQHLTAQGRKIEDVPLVLQYNRRDQVDENAVERLHRKLGLKGACFEAVASDGTGVLQTLTTLSKLVLAELRKALDEVSQTRNTPAKARVIESVDPLEPPTGTGALTARVAPGRRAAAPEKGFSIESAGPVEGGGSEIVIPVRLVDEASGRRVEIAVRVAIDSV
ncbi:MAG TPA: GTPase domain-containing protein [Myxococcota bacterium]|nr:GTPase domain-containing protein [Myxococcota bacterium]